MRLLVLSAILLIALFGIPKARSGEYKWECRNKPMNHQLDVPNCAAECEREYKYKKPDGRKGPLCQAFCTGQKLSVFDGKGAVNKTGLLWRADYHYMDDEVIKESKKKYEECIQLYEKGVENGPTDPFCLNYTPFWTCIWVATTIVCQNGFDPKVIGIDVPLNPK